MITPDELGLDPLPTYQKVERTYQKLAARALERGNFSRAGHALLAVAWAHEKQGRGESGISVAKRAATLLDDQRDQMKLAECNHSLGVWEYHNIPDSFPVGPFERATRLRIESGQFLAAAQSAHNGAFVFLTAGDVKRAQSGYDEAESLLERAAYDDGSGQVAESARRQLGFVLSHRAFAAARYHTPEEGLEAALAYFEHVNKTQAHREPVYAYLATGIALRPKVNHRTSSVCRRLEKLTGISPDSEAWFRYAVQHASEAMSSGGQTGTGRRAYLGALLLALSELAEWCFSVGVEDEARILAGRAHKLATARGWHAEAERVYSVVSRRP